MTPRQAALLGCLAALWGSSYLLIKYALAGFAPGEIVWFRAAVSAALLWPLCWARGGATRAALGAARRRPLAVLGLGFAAVAAPFTLISFGERAVPSGLTAILIAPSPIFVAALAPLLDRDERLTPAQWGGLAVGLGGVALLVGVESVHSVGALLGSLAMILASFSYAAGSYVVKQAFRGMPSLTVSALSLAGAALLTLPLAAATARHGAPGAGAVAALAALAITHTGLAFVIFYKLIGELGAGRANLVAYLTPPFALAYGAIFRGEAIGWAAVAGLALILGGVALASRRRARAVVVATPPEPAPLIPSGSAPSLGGPPTATPPAPTRRPEA